MVLMAICLLGLIAFFVMMDEVFFDAPEPWDMAVLHWMDKIHSPPLDAVMWALSTAGDPIPLAAVGGLMMIGFFLSRKFWYAAGFLSTVAGGLALNLAIKGAPRERPPLEQHLVEAWGASFPSGHAMVSVCFYGFVAYITFRHFKTLWGRVLYWMAIALLVVLISASRVYFLVHYPTDIIAGWMAGAAWLCANLMVLEGQRYHGSRTLREVWLALCGRPCNPPTPPPAPGEPPAGDPAAPRSAPT